MAEKRRIEYHKEWCRCGNCVMNPMDEMLHDLQNMQTHIRIWNDTDLLGFVNSSITHLIGKYK